MFRSMWSSKSISLQNGVNGVPHVQMLKWLKITYPEHIHIAPSYRRCTLIKNQPSFDELTFLLSCNNWVFFLHLSLCRRNPSMLATVPKHTDKSVMSGSSKTIFKRVIPSVSVKVEPNASFETQLSDENQRNSLLSMSTGLVLCSSEWLYLDPASHPAWQCNQDLWMIQNWSLIPSANDQVIWAV